MKQQIAVPGTWESIETLLAFSDSVEAGQTLTPDQAYLMRLVVEEIATNIVKYGYAEGEPGPIELTCSCEGGLMTLTIRDRGRPFDPRDHPDPDLASDDPASRDVGGLGLYFVREFADSVSYQHDPRSGWNELRVTRGKSSLYDLLSRVPLFQHLAPEQLRAIAAGLGERLLGAGEVLFHQGDPGGECFVILGGSLEVLTFVNGEELRLDLFHSGQLVGEMALIDRSPRSATVRATETAHLAVLTEADFKALLAANPDLALDVLRSGTTRVRNTNHRIVADLERKNAQLLSAYEQLKAAQAELIRLSRIEEELAVARRIQQSFLPRQLPQPPGWQVAGFSRGAQAVGGDFYDCIELADGRIGLVVADACGKGITAALFVALTRSLLRAASQAPWIFQGGMVLDAESVLTGALWLVNDYICREHADSEMFITLFYAVLDPRDGRLAYVNAGHNPPLVMAADGQGLRELEGGTLPIGILAAQSYEVAHDRIGPGERLIGFSDGMTEATRADNALFNDDQLHAALRAHAGLEAAALVEAVVADVDAFVAGAPQADDMTLLIAARAA